jgi:hypothetical protein
MSTEAISPLRQRMIEDMSSRKLGIHTQRSHIYSCKRFAKFLKRSPGLQQSATWRFMDTSTTAIEPQKEVRAVLLAPDTQEPSLGLDGAQTNAAALAAHRRRRGVRGECGRCRPRRGPLDAKSQPRQRLQ